MGPGVPREAQRLVCVCTNEFAQTLPSALRYFVADASAPYRTARESSCSLPRRGGSRRISRSCRGWCESGTREAEEDWGR
jgi:hypothetical protein